MVVTVFKCECDPQVSAILQEDSMENVLPPRWTEGSTATRSVIDTGTSGVALEMPTFAWEAVGT